VGNMHDNISETIPKYDKLQQPEKATKAGKQRWVLLAPEINAKPFKA
jgi:hypothetical protein